VGELTSVSPVAVDGLYHALGYLKRSADAAMIQTAAGIKVILWPNAESSYAWSGARPRPRLVEDGWNSRRVTR
jgi:hypothetical protein